MSSLGLLGLKRSTQTSGHKSLVCVETSFQPTERGQVNEILQPASDPEVNQSTSRWWFDFWRCFQDFIHPTARRATWYCMPDYRHAWLGRAVGQSISLKLPGSKREEVPNDALTDGKERNRLKLRSSWSRTRASLACPPAARTEEISLVSGGRSKRSSRSGSGSSINHKRSLQRLRLGSELIDEPDQEILWSIVLRQS